MTRTQLSLFAALLLVSYHAYAANSTSDSSLTLGNPASGGTMGNQGYNPIIWSKGTCQSQPLWQLVPNPWGVNSDAKGSITMNYPGNGTIVTKVDLTGLRDIGVNAMPFVFYGKDTFGYHMWGQPLKFPAQISSMKSMYVDIDYDLTVPGKAPGNLNVAFDEWIIPSADYKNGFSGALEVMVAPYFVFGWGAPGSLVGTITIPVTLNGVYTPMVFNHYSTGRGAGSLQLFFPRDNQIQSGNVRFNLLEFIKVATQSAGISSSWYVAGIDFGTEFGHTTAAKYTLTTNKLSIEQEFIK